MSPSPNDTDNDRHGIVTRSAGLMNPNHYLAVSISYLFKNRHGWPKDAAIGKTVVSSSMIDRVASRHRAQPDRSPSGLQMVRGWTHRRLIGFGGEESAGASFLRLDGTVWTTDKDGIVPGLLAAEITAKAGRDPGELYRDLTREFGSPCLSANRCAGERRAKAHPCEAVAGSNQGDPARGGADHRKTHRGARQRRANRRPQSDHRRRMVRRAAFGHRGSL